MKPKNNTKIERDRESPKSPWIEDYLDCFSFTMKPVTKAFIDRLAQEYITWSKEDPEALDIHDFYFNKNINRETFRRWRLKYPQLSEAHEFALHYIGSRRDKGALKRTFSEGAYKAKQAMYDKDFVKCAEWASKIKQEEEKSQQPSFVVIPSIEELKKRMDENT